jgi:nicotinamidase-related amidase
VPKNSPVFSGAPKAGMFQLGKWGTQIHEALEQRVGDVQVVKNRVSPFYSTNLMAQLSAQGITRIYCSGVSTQAVVQATVRDGHDRDFEMIVLEDACCAHSEQEHANSMGSIARFCKVTTSAEVSFE